MCQESEKSNGVNFRKDSFTSSSAILKKEDFDTIISNMSYETENNVKFSVFADYQCDQYHDQSAKYIESVAFIALMNLMPLAYYNNFGEYIADCYLKLSVSFNTNLAIITINIRVTMITNDIFETSQQHIDYEDDFGILPLFHVCMREATDDLLNKVNFNVTVATCACN